MASGGRFSFTIDARSPRATERQEANPTVPEFAPVGETVLLTTPAGKTDDWIHRYVLEAVASIYLLYEKDIVRHTGYHLTQRNTCDFNHLRMHSKG